MRKREYGQSDFQETVLVWKKNRKIYQQTDYHGGGYKDILL